MQCLKVKHIVIIKPKLCVSDNETKKDIDNTLSCTIILDGSDKYRSCDDYRTQCFVF